MGVKERRLREKLRRKSEIIEAAETVIFEKGIHVATMSDIAKQAELGKATLYGYYKSKDEILLEINERAMNRLSDAFLAVHDERLTGLEQVRMIGQAYFRFAIECPNYFKFIQLFEANTLKVKMGEVLRNMMKVDGTLSDAIRRGIEDGTLRADLEPKTVAKCLWAMATGIQQMIEQRGEIFNEYFDITGQMIFDSFFTIVENGLMKH